MQQVDVCQARDTSGRNLANKGLFTWPSAHVLERVAILMTDFSYSVFGLAVRSEVDLPDLTELEASGAPDVVVKIADVPEHLPHARRALWESQVTADAWQFDFDGVARFRAVRGAEVLVAPAPGADVSILRAYLLGTVFAAVLYQRGLFPLHGSAVACGGRVIAFCGPSGAGKSSLAAALADKGMEPLCDDVGVIVPQISGSPLFLPGVARLKLWRDMLAHLGHSTDGLHPVANGPLRDKFRLKAPAVQPMKAGHLAGIYQLVRQGEGGERFRDLFGGDRMRTVLGNAYRGTMPQALGTQPAHFQRAAAIAGAVRLREFRRPWGLADMAASTEALMEDMEEMLRSSPHPHNKDVLSGVE